MRFRLQDLLAAAFAASLGCHPSFANVTAEEAAKLKSTLMPLGGERGGNADGSIPAWTGGLNNLPPGTTAASKMPDFFQGEAKVLTVDAGNADKYADKLAPGVLFLLKNYAGYKINIYPTHRTASAPQWFYDGTFRNATSATLKDDNWVVGAKGGLPYPIPQNGKEAIWNHNLAWFGVQSFGQASSYIVSPGGQPLLNATTLDQRWFPMSDNSYTSGEYMHYYLLAREQTVGPPNRVGNAILSYVTFDQTESPLITWQYLVGQRRLRKAPQVTYDGAYPDCGGIMTVDELALFNGPIDRYNAKLLGKREMYIPYNNNGMTNVSSTHLLQPNYLNPDDVRWELHRVWTVDLTLAPGKRHLLPHRRVYLDEDTWNAVDSEDYNADGTLVKIGQAFSFNLPAFPGTISTENVFYDTRGSGYCVVNAPTSDHPQERTGRPVSPAYPPSFFASATLAAESVR